MFTAILAVMTIALAYIIELARHIFIKLDELLISFLLVQDGIHEFIMGTVYFRLLIGRVVAFVALTAKHRLIINQGAFLMREDFHDIDNPDGDGTTAIEIIVTLNLAETLRIAHRIHPTAFGMRLASIVLEQVFNITPAPEIEYRTSEPALENIELKTPDILRQILVLLWE
jgi:hypothetical protein